jgi:hypothetical protein
MKIPFLYYRFNVTAHSTRRVKLHTLQKERMLSHVKIPKYNLEYPACFTSLVKQTLSLSLSLSLTPLSPIVNKNTIIRNEVIPV